MKKLIALGIFGIAFGLLEAIVVIYIQNILKTPIRAPFLSNVHTFLNLGAIAFISTKTPILKTALLTITETIRELATIVMLLALAYVSGESLKQKLGAFLVTFAFWDIFYYVFLRIFIGWPKSIFDKDIFFLIPAAWVGPVITPISISFLLMLIGSKFFLQNFHNKI